MAIPFLNNLDITDNQLLNAKLHVTPTAPTAAAGQIYFDSTTNPTSNLTAKYYSNGADQWVSLKEYSFPTGTYVTGAVTGTTPKPIITFDLNAVDGTAVAGERYLTKSNTWAEVSGITGTTYDLEGVGSTNGTAGVRLTGSDATDDDVLIVGAGTTTVTRSGNTLTVTSNDQFIGTVTSVDAGITGDAISISGVPFTTSGSIDFSFDGTDLEYIDGEGNLATFPTIPTVNDGTLTVQGTGVLGGTGTFTANDADNVTISISHDNTSRTDTTSSASGNSFTVVDSVTTNATGHVTAINVKTQTVSDDDTTSLPIKNAGGTTQFTSTDVTGLRFEGGTNVTVDFTPSDQTVKINSTDQYQGTLTSITEGPGITVTPSATSPTVAVDYLGSDNYLLEAGAATVASSADIINFSDDTDSNVKKTTLGTIPVNSLTLVKNYIDSSVSGGVYYQGGYDPTTDLTSPGNYGLQTPPNPNIIEIGWMYTVTADGTFFGEQVRVGDVLIAEIDAPTSLSDWTTVQNNIDLATSLVVGLGNVVPGSSNTVTAPYTSGTATLDVVDSTPTQKGAIIVDAGTGISVSYTSGTATVTNTQTNSVNTYAVTISDTATITHNLGTKDVIIQLYDVVTNETVYADIVRVNTSPFNTATITFSATPTNDVRVLVQKIG